ncbi:hypothetical protein UK23_32340 [Lentzea aerocolonigenes]|uniref:Major facilitator superfamily (MFS) profile domain-containing protein n=1 Tax=Lentzea aerocolonigenes TaxID=68170 RepID=A0A0F0GJC8_LENAE|nr:MFS transporter [Lentzea aerocolonigenes]KJK43664.1 hypothetical protein UK23_32340 [Lentzea aerocolonigenes]
MSTLMRSRPFILLWTSTLVSSSGTVLTILALSIAVYERTGLNLAASAVSATQWLMPVLLAPLLASLCVRFAPRHLVVAAEGVSAVAALGIGLLVGPAPLVAGGLLLVRSFLDAVTRSGTPIALKRTLPEDVVARGVAHCEAARLYGAAIGALAGTLLLGTVPLTTIMLINTGTLLVSAVVLACARLPRERHNPVAPRGRDVLAGALATVRANPLLLRAFVLLAATTAPQALHNIGRTALSIEHLGLDSAGVAALAIVTTVALGVGALLASVSSRPTLSAAAAWVLLVAPAALLIVASIVTGVTASFATYGLFVVLFEVGFVWFSALLVHRAPLAAIEEIAALRTVVLPGVLCVALVGFGLLVDVVGLLGGALAYLGCAAVIGVAQQRLLARAPGDARKEAAPVARDSAE